MKQYEAVIETLDKLGGVATLGELNREVFKISDCEWKTKTPFASIRRIVQQTKGIYKIKPGLYGLEKYRKQIEDRGIIVETEKNKDSNDVIMFNHTYYQGILLIIGKYRNMQTFMGHRTKRFLLVGENGRKTLKTNRFRHGMGNGQNISKRFPFT